MADNIGDYFRKGMARMQGAVNAADNSARRMGFKQRSANPDTRTAADRAAVAARQKRQLARAAAAKAKGGY